MKTNSDWQNIIKKILKKGLKIGPRRVAGTQLPTLNTHLLHNDDQNGKIHSPFRLFLTKKTAKKDYQDRPMPDFNIPSTNNGRLINTNPVFSVKKTGQLPQNRLGKWATNRPIGTTFRHLSPTVILLKRSIFITYQNRSNGINWIRDFRNLCD